MDDLEIFRKLAQCEDKEQMQRCIDEYHESHKLTFTNADLIRAMSDEELCKFLCECKFCDICEEGCDSCTYSGDCDKRLLDWLKQPMEVDA